MIKENELKAERLKGYQVGYAAGLRRQKRERLAEQLRAKEVAFKERVFCAAMQGLLAREGHWKIGEREVNNCALYAELCWRFADEAWKQRYRA